MLRLHTSLKNRLSWVQMMDFNPKEQLETAHSQHFTISTWVANNLFKIYSKISTEDTLMPHGSKVDKKEHPLWRDIHKFVIKSMNSVACHPIMYPLGVYYLYHYMMREEIDVPFKRFLLYFSVCITLASKMYEDLYYNNFHYMNFFWESKEVRIEEFNEIEKDILKHFKYNLCIHYNDLKLFLIQNSI